MKKKIIKEELRRDWKFWIETKRRLASLHLSKRPSRREDEEETQD